MHKEEVLFLSWVQIKGYHEFKSIGRTIVVQKRVQKFRESIDNECASIIQFIALSPMTYIMGSNHYDWCPLGEKIFNNFLIENPQ